MASRLYTAKKKAPSVRGGEDMGKVKPIEGSVKKKVTYGPDGKAKKTLHIKKSVLKKTSVKAKDGKTYRNQRDANSANRKWDLKTPAKGDYDERTGKVVK
tara:strand:- start:413 stop:712 length:300 start_codon:yes stop_codon:yes gene_type:complete